MKSEALHKFLAFFPLLIACAWSQPLDTTQQRQQPPVAPQSVFFIKNNIRPEDAPNYQITIPKHPNANEPCLTITWKTNPDGTGPESPQIYMGNGYFGIMPPADLNQQKQ
ncbi:uncharacterized protein LOC110178983 [Drosophila serrata]|uniref:uncharacterized protein LOC110178983 n=1 Tax=Drosophila serrata TaxID=7274 RepID=UPI000A1D102E|nr:uncharacterized protein LOC110178983 [Drosophila serrata]XP_020801956.1 uncharacterized protein LOC110178983 [Drosophila serrata]KAH8376501.1 hypothetical protein KR200_006865 [Drosophila serrata]